MIIGLMITPCWSCILADIKAYIKIKRNKLMLCLLMASGAARF